MKTENEATFSLANFLSINCTSCRYFILQEGFSLRNKLTITLLCMRHVGRTYARGGEPLQHRVSRKRGSSFVYSPCYIQSILALQAHLHELAWSDVFLQIPALLCTRFVITWSDYNHVGWTHFKRPCNSYKFDFSPVTVAYTENVLLHEKRNG